MKMRGAFDPKVQVGITFIVIALFVWLAVETVNPYVEPDSARLDLKLLPVALLLGMAVGVPIGIWKLQALRKTLPEAGNHFYLTDSALIGRLPEGANASTLRRVGIGAAFVIWMALAGLTQGRYLLYGSLGSYILGQFLTGQTLPFVRLWIEQKRAAQPNG